MKCFLTALYAEEQYIYRISYVYLKQEQEALENVQEVAFRAWKYRKSLKEVTYFKTWLTRITINSALRLLKKHQQLTLTYEDTGAVDDIESSSFENLVVDQLYLADLLERLEVKERSLLLLRYQADYSFQEIADLLDIPVSTVKSTLYRAIQKLQRHQMKGGESG